MGSIVNSVREQGDRHDDEFTIEMDCSVDDFAERAIPTAVGFWGLSHGLTDLSYVDRTLTFKKLDNPIA